MTDRFYTVQAEEAPAAAADWVVRLRAPEAGETDWLAFEAWLAAAPPNREAFDAAQRLWMEVDARREDLAAAVEAGSGGGMSPRSAARAWRPTALGALAVAAGLALLAPLAANLAGGLTAPKATVYATTKGERRTLWLADGTRVDMNSDSRLSVRMAAGRREVTMEGAEAAFDVTHDAARPFVIHAGDQAVRVVGTQFDVARRDGRIAVTVRRGVVRVSAASGAGAVSLTPGLQLRHREGAADSTIVEEVSADDAFAWRDGRLIYRDAALGDVVDDLNHYFDRPIRLDAGAAALRFSGVLTVDDEARTLGRLTALLPLKTRDAKGGAVAIEARGAAR
jgi:transmembrane sensor